MIKDADTMYLKKKIADSFCNLSIRIMIFAVIFSG